MYYLLLIFCYSVSILPLWLLYGISDGLFVLIYHIIRYRREVVNNNLQQAFPDKSPKEIDALAKKYYRNLTDMMVETIKLLTMSKKQLQRRFICDLSVLHQLYAQGKSCQLHLGHNFNWEWANLFCMQGVAFPFLVVYMPITNKAVDRMFRHFREKFGTTLIPANDMREAMNPWMQKQYLIALVADQNPGNPRRCYWFPFLNKMTPFYKGPEMAARRHNIPVVFADIRKTKRGYYKAELKLAFEEPLREPEGKITEAFVQFLEKNIHEQPEVWVWSHRRWKHQYNPVSHPQT
ncbi:lysophospholipid acyltransferase family protein [Chitinophaga pendula]|uniref:lysophospholipid acyltransferase family protein n=1 Tax=Chitinophaga TaxID=79328 RepID=UPI000BAFFDEB|nr:MULTISPECIES: lysophospholipid acyltransferase family protein [Chitinophaga]ASZ10570.1 lipid A biosynthesis acyltransferase [Chitinophaga sp. MD30]UCJ06456.1 lysophospholipid acyltransferase family protein [Chitinophaga pendula]